MVLVQLHNVRVLNAFRSNYDAIHMEPARGSTDKNSTIAFYTNDFADESHHWSFHKLNHNSAKYRTIEQETPCSRVYEKG